ncbi:hypothetical protein AB0N73_04035 [Microbacterium sp. NPDC089189]|uniref:hypothetical protein n=1 Tax=Microbacterium sp. NPDC089189 TaxID=3154972 RepID=UPI00341BB96D
MPVARDVQTHLERSVVHMETGDRLKAADDEWFAVCYFYSAYHLVKAAMHADPIFDDISRCSGVHPLLSVDSRYVEHHSGGKGENGRSLGMNEIVMKLYRSIRVPYHRLHTASIAVRYQGGLAPISPITVADDFTVVREEYLANNIVAPA